MRQRKAKDLEKRLQECSGYLIENPGEGSRDYFDRKDEKRELFLEIGCGKGQFILKKAADNPDADFIAVEGQETVILRALEKAKEHDEAQGADGNAALSNLKFMLTFVHSMDELFDPGQLSGIYLNFSFFAIKINETTIKIFIMAVPNTLISFQLLNILNNGIRTRFILNSLNSVE